MPVDRADVRDGTLVPPVARLSDSPRRSCRPVTPGFVNATHPVPSPADRAQSSCFQRAAASTAWAPRTALRSYRSCARSRPPEIPRRRCALRIARGNPVVPSKASASRNALSVCCGPAPTAARATSTLQCAWPAARGLLGRQLPGDQRGRRPEGRRRARLSAGVGVTSVSLTRMLTSRALARTWSNPAEAMCWAQPSPPTIHT